MSETEPYTESDVIESFVALCEATGAYLDIVSVRNADPEALARLHKSALTALTAAHQKAEDILAWISAEPDEEIDDAALDDALGLDGDDEDDDLDEDDGDWDDEDEDEDDDE